MIKTLWNYFREDVACRASAIVFTSEMLIALLVAAAFGWRGERIFHDGPTVVDVAPMILSYSAIAMGFCIAGLTVSLTLPDREFAEYLAKSRSKRQLRDSYSDLLFVFSWTAVCHWFAIIGLVVAILFAPKTQSLMKYGAPVWSRWLGGLVVFVCLYSFFQFLITLITLSQVGSVYITQLRNKKVSKPVSGHDT
jgi:hypothetical protein